MEASVGGRRAVRNAAKDREQQRVERGRQEIAALERQQPLRRRILEALAVQPGTPSDLAKRLETAAESASRKLAELRDEGLVRRDHVIGDRRQRLYAITPAGALELSRHRAFGAAGRPPDVPDLDTTARFLQSAVARAVDARRRSNKLGEAAERLRAVSEEAEEAGVYVLAVEALAELATTLRQARQRQAVEEVLTRLEQIAFGQDPRWTAAHALPAAAYREYALGRLCGEREDIDPAVAASHLISATTLFRQLAQADSSRSWRHREAWGVVSLAANLRAQTRLEEALRLTGDAMLLFDELDDAYGRSHCLFMAGFCLRLLGDYNGAWQWLSRAHALATEHGFERFQADSLMQMGEVRRCQGDVGQAAPLLEEALKRAHNMGLVVTEAFARSALGAVAYQEARVSDAESALLRAHEMFVACEHREGFALNARRQAVVARRAWMEGQRKDQSRIRAWIDLARTQYARLRAPAGVAACDIERARLLLLQNGRAPGLIKRLISLLDLTPQRNLLELDPWVPTVLDAFAEETGDEGLCKRAEALVSAADRRLAERAREGLRWSAQTPPAQTRRGIGRRSAARLQVNEMGGETRHEAEPPELAPAAAA